MKKNIIALLLALCMIAGCCTVFAIKTSTPNIALGKPVTADSEYGLGGMGPELANDGDIYTTWSQGYSGINSFWQVDLLQPYFISKVIVHARWDMDNDTSRRNFEIQLSNDVNFGEYETVYSMGEEGFPYHESLSVNVSASQAYRYLRLQKMDGEYFTLGEVEVYEMETAGQNYGNIEGQKYAKAAKLLDYLGIMSTATFQAEQLVTRAEALKLAFAVLGLDENVFANDASEQMFYDVLPDHPYYQTVQTAWAMGWIDCPDDRLFRPQAFITGDALMKILLHALGYGDSLDYLGTFPANVRRKAADVGLYQKMSVDGYDFVDQQTMALFLYNALTVPAADVLIETDRLTLEEGESLLTGKYQLKEERGIITENNVSNLTNAVSYFTGHIKIGQKDYQDLVGDMNRWLGYRVDYFVDISDGENEIVLYDCSSSDNNTAVMQGRDLISSNDDIMNGSFRFTSDAGANQSFALSRGFSVIYNGVADVEYTGYDFKDHNAEITFLDNNNDGEYEIVFLDTYQTAVIASAGRNNDEIRITLESGGSLVLPVDDSEGYLYLRTIDGGLVRPDMLESGDLITFAISRDGNAVKLYAGERIVSGTIDEIEEGEITYVVIGGVHYEVDSSYFASLENGSSIAKELEPGNKVSLRLNWLGQIAALSASSESGMFEYTILIAADIDQGIAGNIRLKVFRQSGTHEIWNLTDPIVIDGVRMKLEEVSDRLASGDESLLPAGVVRARFTDNGISEIDTPYINVSAGETKENSLDETIADASKAIYYKAALPCLYRAGDYRMYLRTELSSPVFVIPVDDTGKPSNATSDQKIYESQTVGTEFIDENNTNIYSYYDVDEFSKTPAAFVKHVSAGTTAQTVDETDPVMLIDSATRAIDENGLEVVKISGYNASGEVQFTAKEDLLYVQEDDAGNITESFPVTSLSKGDIIHYTPRNSEIGAFVLIFDCSEDKALMESKPGLEVWYSAGWATYDQVAASTRAVYGLALKRNKSLLSVCDRIPTGSNEEDIYTRTEIYNTDAKPIYLYSEAANRLQKVNAADLDNIVYDINSNGRVIVITARANLQFIVGYDFENIN